MIRLTTAWTNWTASRVPVMEKGRVVRKPGHRGGKDRAVGSVLSLQTQRHEFDSQLSVVVHTGNRSAVGAESGGSLGLPVQLAWPDH